MNTVSVGAIVAIQARLPYNASITSGHPLHTAFLPESRLAGPGVLIDFEYQGDVVEDQRRGPPRARRRRPPANEP